MPFPQEGYVVTRSDGFEMTVPYSPRLPLVVGHYNDPWWQTAGGIAYLSPPTLEELGVEPYVDWEEAEDWDDIVPLRPVLRPTAGEFPSEDSEPIYVLGPGLEFDPADYPELEG